MPRSVRQNSDPSPDDSHPLTPKHLTKQEFGRRLERIMLEKGMTQADLARASDLGRDSISIYIRGRSFPTPTSLQKLARALNVEYQALLPNAIESAADAEHPALELRQVAGHPTKAWLRVNQAVSFETAAKIVELIQADIAKGID